MVFKYGCISLTMNGFAFTFYTLPFKDPKNEFPSCYFLRTCLFNGNFRLRIFNSDSTLEMFYQIVLKLLITFFITFSCTDMEVNMRFIDPQNHIWTLD